MPARKRNYRKRKKPKPKVFSKFLLLLLAILVLGVIFFLPSAWEKDAKLLLAVHREKGNAEEVIVFDPQAEEITTIVIPGNTEVEVSRQLGTWRLKSIWQLGINEGRDGQLLAETITKNLKIPVTAWTDEPGRGFAGGTGLFKALFLPYKTSLNLGDRIKLAKFSLGVKDFKRTEIDLVMSTYLKREKLTDGEEGFVITTRLPRRLLLLVSDTGISDQKLTTTIIDQTGVPGIAEEIGEILAVVGTKVASVTKEETEETDCLVISRDQKAAQKIAKVFSCQTERNRIPAGNFDIEMVLGEGFAERF